MEFTEKRTEHRSFVFLFIPNVYCYFFYSLYVSIVYPRCGLVVGTYVSVREVTGLIPG